MMMGRDGHLIMWAGVAYADDGLWVAPTVAGLEVKLQGAGDFFSVIGPDMSLPKTLVCRLGKKEKGEGVVSLTNRHTGEVEHLKEVEVKEQFRHLGVFINGGGGKSLRIGLLVTS